MRSALSLALGVCLGVAVVVSVNGCGMFGASLNARAIRYYSFMVGLEPGAKYSSYLSPAYRGTFDRAALLTLDSTRSSGKIANKRFSKPSTSDVAMATQDRFAYSLVNPELGDAFAALAPVRWVKVGRGWYLFLGSDAEIGAYGDFPRGLSPPTAPWQDNAAESPADQAQ